MGHRIQCGINAGKICVTGKTMLFGRIFHAINTVMISIMLPYIGEKDGSMASPEIRIPLPEYFSAFFLIIDAEKFGTMIINGNFQKIIFQNSLHIVDLHM